MQNYPINVPHFDYRGRDAGRRERIGHLNATAKAVCQHVNNSMKTMDAGSVREFSIQELAKATDADFDIVSEVVAAMGDFGGITASKGEFD